MLNARYRHHCRASGFVLGPFVSLDMKGGTPPFAAGAKASDGSNNADILDLPKLGSHSEIGVA